MPARVYELQFKTTADPSAVTSLTSAISGLDQQGKQLGQGWSGLDKLKAAAAEMAEIKERLGSGDYGFLPQGQMDQDLARIAELRTELKQLEAEADNVGADFREFSKALKLAEDATLSQAKAAGVNKEQLKQIGAVYDDLRIKSRLYQQETMAGRMSPLEAGGRLADDLKKLSTTDLSGLQRIPQETAKAEQGVTALGKATTQTGGNMRITESRAAMLTQSIAGLVSQAMLGGDSMQLLGSASTHLAMVMATGGPLGIALGFITQLVATLGIQYAKTAEESAKAEAKARTDARARVDQLGNMRAAQHDWAKSVKETENAYDLMLTKLGLALAQNERLRGREEQDLADQQRQEEDEDRRAVEGGTMTESEAAQRKFDREDAAAEQKVAHAKERADEAEREAEAKIAALDAKQREDQQAAVAAEKRYQDAVRAKNQDDVVKKASERIEGREKAIESNDSALAVVSDVLMGPMGLQARMNREAQNQMLRASQEKDRAIKKAAEDEAAAIRAQYPDLDRGEEGVKKAKEDKLTAAKTRDENFDKRKGEAARYLDEANAAREAYVQADTHESRNRDYRDSQRERGMVDAGKRDEQKDVQVAQSKVEDLSREGDSKSKELIAALEALQKSQEGKNGDFTQKLGAMVAALQDGTNPEEMNRIVTALQQHMSATGQTMSMLATTARNMAQSSLAIQQQIAALQKEVADLTSKMKGAQ